MTIYDIAENFGKAFPRAFTAENITSGFRVSGICPYDRHIFPDDEFLGSFVTDRPPNASTAAPLDANTNALAQTTSDDSGGGPHQSGATLPETPPSGTKYLSLSDVRPFPKAPERKPTSKGRQRGKTQVLTDTPVKAAVEENLLNRSMKRSKSTQDNSTKTTKSSKRVNKTPGNKTKQGKQRKLYFSDSESDEDLVLNDDSDDYEEDVENDNETAEIGSYVVVKYASKKSVKHFVGKVLDRTEDDSYSVKFLVRQPSKHSHHHFSFPEEDDVDDIPDEDVIAVLPEPASTGGTKRAASRLVFHGVDFSDFNLV